jgi:poly-gamma-glutamate synthesis protein (capsule biosynthesis protein)
LRTDVSAVKGLKKTGINIVSLANNHSFDYGHEAFIENRNILIKNDIKCVGGGKNIKEASQFTLFDVNSICFAFLAYCSKDASCFHFASNSSHGVASLEPNKIYQDIKRAKSRSDFVIVSLHWGEEFRDYPSPYNVEIARSLIDNGATIVVGSHSHVFQGYEKYKNGLILYDLGSFIFGDIHMNTPIKYRYSLTKRKAKEGMMVDCLFNKNGFKNYKFIPTRINTNFQVTIPNEIVKMKILNRFEKLSIRISSQRYAFFYSNVYLFKIKIKLIIKRFFQYIRISLKKKSAIFRQ